jgi:xylulokinase
MRVECVVAVDLGTQTTRAALVSRDGRVLGVASRPNALHSPMAGLVEQSPEGWWSSTLESLAEVVGRHPAVSVSCVAVGAQMHSVVPLDIAGRPLDERVGLWCDKRAMPQVDRFLARSDAASLAGVAGNAPVAAWSGFKIAWYRDARPGIYERATRFLVTKDFLNLRLCGEIATDPTEASGSFLASAGSLAWSDGLLAALGVERSLLPPIAGSTQVIGGILGPVADATGLAKGTPVVAGAGDMLCQLLAAGVDRAGRSAEIAGTAVIVAAHAPRAHEDPRVMSLRAIDGGWVDFGIGDSAGTCLRWLSDLLGEEPGPGVVSNRPSPYPALDEAASLVPAGSDGLLFLPYLLGERTLGSATARGSFVGLTLGHRTGHLARAILEGICFDNRRALDLIAPTPAGAEIRCTGGGSRSPLWNQLRADIYERPVLTVSSSEGGLAGAAMLASVGAGWYANVAEAAEHVVELDRRWCPSEATRERYRSSYATFCALHDVIDPLWPSWPDRPDRAV